jgi:arginyl-tRNA synthetase
VAGPGFLNVFLAEDWFVSRSRTCSRRRRVRRRPPEHAEKVLIEFVSAEPDRAADRRRAAPRGRTATRCADPRAGGPHGRREYYFNDSGSQVDRLGQSIRARARGEALPEDGYEGDYVSSWRARSRTPPSWTRRSAPSAASRRSWPASGRRSRPTASSSTPGSSSAASTTVTRAPVQRALAMLEEQGHTYRSEGALWLRTSQFGDDKDRVLVRSSGETTYFANDVAYHENKLERGYDRMVNLLGSDHHGYIARMKAAMAALGVEPERLEIPILQFVHIVEGGRRASMSKRRGDFVTLTDLIEEIGVERDPLLHAQPLTRVDGRPRPRAGARAVEREPGLLRAIRPRADRSMLAKAGDERVEAALGAGAHPQALHPAERELIKKLLAFPAEVAEAVRPAQPARIAAYALELAQVFTAFYRDCHVGDAGSDALRSLLAGPVRATRRSSPRYGVSGGPGAGVDVTRARRAPAGARAPRYASVRRGSGS